MPMSALDGEAWFATVLKLVFLLDFRIKKERDGLQQFRILFFTCIEQGIV